jgi:hypothetical protein
LGAAWTARWNRSATDRVVGVHVNAATFGFIPFGKVADEERATLTEVPDLLTADIRDFFRPLR